MISIEQHIIHYLEGRCHFARSQEAETCFTMATLPRVNLRHLSHWPSQWNRLHLPHTLSLRPFYRGVGGWDNRSSSCTRDSARQPRNASVPTGSLGYDVYPATIHVTAIFISLVTETRPQQVWRTVTAIYARLAAQQLWRTVTANIFSLTHS